MLRRKITFRQFFYHNQLEQRKNHAFNTCQAGQLPILVKIYPCVAFEGTKGKELLKLSGDPIWPLLSCLRAGEPGAEGDGLAPGTTFL